MHRLKLKASVRFAFSVFLLLNSRPENALAASYYLQTLTPPFSLTNEQVSGGFQRYSTVDPEIMVQNIVKQHIAQRFLHATGRQWLAPLCNELGISADIPVIACTFGQQDTRSDLAAAVRNQLAELPPDTDWTLIQAFQPTHDLTDSGWHYYAFLVRAGHLAELPSANDLQNPFAPQAAIAYFHHIRVYTGSDHVPIFQTLAVSCREGIQYGSAINASRNYIVGLGLNTMDESEFSELLASAGILPTQESVAELCTVLKQFRQVSLRTDPATGHRFITILPSSGELPVENMIKSCPELLPGGTAQGELLARILRQHKFHYHPSDIDTLQIRAYRIHAAGNRNETMSYAELERTIYKSEFLSSAWLAPFLAVLPQTEMNIAPVLPVVVGQFSRARFAPESAADRQTIAGLIDRITASGDRGPGFSYFVLIRKNYLFNTAAEADPQNIQLRLYIVNNRLPAEKLTAALAQLFDADPLQHVSHETVVDGHQTDAPFLFQLEAAFSLIDGTPHIMAPQHVARHTAFRGKGQAYALMRIFYAFLQRTFPLASVQIDIQDRGMFTEFFTAFRQVETNSPQRDYQQLMTRIKQEPDALNRFQLLRPYADRFFVDAMPLRGIVGVAI